MSTSKFSRVAESRIKWNKAVERLASHVPTTKLTALRKEARENVLFITSGGLDAAITEILDTLADKRDNRDPRHSRGATGLSIADIDSIFQRQHDQDCVDRQLIAMTLLPLKTHVDAYTANAITILRSKLAEGINSHVRYGHQKLAQARVKQASGIVISDSDVWNALGYLERYDNQAFKRGSELWRITTTGCHVYESRRLTMEELITCCENAASIATGKTTSLGTQLTHNLASVIQQCSARADGICLRKGAVNHIAEAVMSQLQSHRLWVGTDNYKLALEAIVGQIHGDDHKRDMTQRLLRVNSKFPRLDDIQIAWLADVIRRVLHKASEASGSDVIPSDVPKEKMKEYVGLQSTAALLRGMGSDSVQIAHHLIAQMRRSCADGVACDIRLCYERLMTICYFGLTQDRTVIPAQAAIQLIEFLGSQRIPGHVISSFQSYGYDLWKTVNPKTSTVLCSQEIDLCCSSYGNVLTSLQPIVNKVFHLTATP